MAKILIVDDEPEILTVLGRFFERAGHDVLRARTGIKAVELVQAEHPSVVLLDLRLPDISGFDVLERTREQRPVVIMITGHGDIPLAVQAMQAGAEGFLTKPVELAHLGPVVERALEKAQLRELRCAASTRSGRAAAEMLLGSSPPMRELTQQVELLARSERTVALLVGEPGVGKARTARAIHALSPRCTRPFHELDCALRPEELLESELFGTERAVDGPLPGLFEAADGGTLFLDEIAALPASLQPTLLGVLESGRVRRAAGTRELSVDVRLIAATVRDLATEVTENRFREDLYYRLGVMPLHLPPLRARAPEDVCETVAALHAELALELADAPREITEEALETIGRYPWPGNVRELRNVLERALLMARGESSIDVKHLAAEVRGITVDDAKSHVSRSLAEVERIHIERTLIAHDANRTRAARELGISRATLIKKIREYGLGERPSLLSVSRVEDE
ncbi:MAG: sigma-54-dependent Fis family transcriptional regulator [Gemmatimonadaceae bacterium]|nr:sigma-54-dependent Fis family transcriptional regulator [Gemmatimonadaceae bacterium]